MTDKCPQCGFVYDLTQAAAAGEAINERVGAAVASALRANGTGGKNVIWVPASLAGLAAVMKLIPRPVWRKMES